MTTRLLNDFIAGEAFNDMFKKEITVPIFDINEGILEMAPLDFEYADGAKVQFSIKPLQESDREILENMQFEVKYRRQGENQETTTLKLYTDSVNEFIDFPHKRNRISCSAMRQDTNIIALEHEGKFRRSYGEVKYMLPCNDKRFFFVITNDKIFKERES